MSTPREGSDGWRADSPETRLTVFATLWAFATLFHQADSGWAEDPIDMMKTGAAVAVLFRPSSVRRFLLLNLVQAVGLFSQMPNITNHAVVAFTTSVAILMCARPQKIAGGHIGVDAGRLYLAFAPVARICMLVAYSWAVFHKINADFFYYPISAAADHYRLLAERVTKVVGISLLPTDDWALQSIVGITFVSEASVALCLFFRRTRLFGIAIALGFHFLLGVNNYFDFSSMLYALLFLFTPDDFVGVARDRLAPVLDRLQRVLQAIRSTGVSVGTWSVVAVLAVTLAIGNTWYRLLQLFWVLWVPYGLAACLVFASTLGAWRGRRVTTGGLLPAGWGLAFPLLILLNGAQPYLGLNTRSVFAMFSNLRTEVRWPGDDTNHLLVPSWIKVAGFQEDLVKIVRSSDPFLEASAKRGNLKPFFEFRRYISAAAHSGRKGISVTYVRNGVERSVDNAERDPELSRRYPYIMRKFMLLGDVSTMPRQPTRH